MIKPVRYPSYVFILSFCLILMGCNGLKNDSASVKPSTVHPFFAMDPMLESAKELSWPDRVDLAGRLGYAGLSTSELDRIDEILEAVDRHHIHLFGFYFDVWIDPDKERWDGRVEGVIKKLKGRGTVLWPNVRSKQFSSSDAAGDALAVRVIQKLAELAATSDLRVALYPHTWLWIETTDDALRVVRQVDRDNVGVTFNLCHWLRVEKQRDPRALLERAKPYLMMVSINGADYQATDWPGLIQNLDRGDFDTAGLLCVLRDIGYSGPIGLQNYGIQGDVEQNLRKSIKAWRELNELLHKKSRSTP